MYIRRVIFKNLRRLRKLEILYRLEVVSRADSSLPPSLKNIVNVDEISFDMDSVASNVRV